MIDAHEYALKEIRAFAAHDLDRMSLWDLRAAVLHEDDAVRAAIARRVDFLCRNRPWIDPNTPIYIRHDTEVRRLAAISRELREGLQELDDELFTD
jgi:hypothetical protein